jgi:MarR family transcriptional regulator, organic hydroperoxide resistance regulator
VGARKVQVDAGRPMTKHRQGGFLISKVQQTGGRVFSRMLRERGIEINPTQGRVLFILWEYGSMNIHALAKKVSLGKSTLTTLLDRLEAAGQVVRVPSHEDRRQIQIELTAKNRKMHKAYEDVSAEITELYYTGFSSSEINQFEDYLERILRNLGEQESQNRASKKLANK